MPRRVAGRYQPSRRWFSPATGCFWQPCYTLCTNANIVIRQKVNSSHLCLDCHPSLPTVKSLTLPRRNIKDNRMILINLATHLLTFWSLNFSYNQAHKTKQYQEPKKRKNGLNSKLKHIKAQKSILSRRFRDPYTVKWEIGSVSRILPENLAELFMYMY